MSFGTYRGANNIVPAVHCFEKIYRGGIALLAVVVFCILSPTVLKLASARPIAWGVLGICIVGLIDALTDSAPVVWLRKYLKHNVIGHYVLFWISSSDWQLNCRIFQNESTMKEFIDREDIQTSIVATLGGWLKLGGIYRHTKRCEGWGIGDLHFVYHDLLPYVRIGDESGFSLPMQINDLAKILYFTQHRNVLNLRSLGVLFENYHGAMQDRETHLFGVVLKAMEDIYHSREFGKSTAAREIRRELSHEVLELLPPNYPGREIFEGYLV